MCGVRFFKIVHKRPKVVKICLKKDYVKTISVLKSLKSYFNKLFNFFERYVYFNTKIYLLRVVEQTADTLAKIGTETTT